MRDTNDTHFVNDGERAQSRSSEFKCGQNIEAQFSCSSKVFTLLSEQNNAVDSV